MENWNQPSCYEISFSFSRSVTWDGKRNYKIIQSALMISLFLIFTINFFFFSIFHSLHTFDYTYVVILIYLTTCYFLEGKKKCKKKSSIEIRENKSGSRKLFKMLRNHFLFSIIMLKQFSWHRTEILPIIFF